MSKETPKPVHKSFTNVSTDLTFSSLVEMGGALAYQDFQNVSTDLTFSGLKQSGYQYVLGTIIQEEADELSGSLDSATRIVKKVAHEFSGSLDLAETRPAKITEGEGSLDFATRVVKKTATEFSGSLDIVSAFTPDVESAGSVDRAFRIVRKVAHEFSGSSDTTSFSLVQRQNFSTKISAKVVEYFNYSTVTKMRGINHGNYSTFISGQINSLVGATATGGSNPFDPSVAISGTTIIGPAPPPANAQTVYISIPNTGISTHNSWDGLYRYGVSLDYGGGSFSVGSNTPIGANGQTIQLFGLNAIITRGGGTDGFEYSSTMKGYNASGIFGSAKLNRQINLAIGGSIVASPIVLNPSLIQASANTWLTARSISQVIGSVCGVNVNWSANDVSVKDFSLEPGMKGIDVLQSMAQRVGATLRWFGNNNYYVAYPNQTVGSFVVPNQALITQSGISMEPILDLDTGISGGVNQGIYVLPQISTTSSSINGTTGAPNPSASPSNPTVVQVAKVGKLITDDDPPMIFDLPYNYDQVYVQILVAAGQSTSGANGLGIQNFVTTNPQQVFLLSDTGFANNLIFNTLVGNAYIPQVKIDSRIMPENDAVQAGNFTLTVFCTLKDLSGAYTAAQNDADNNGSAVQQRNPQFIKTHQGKINCFFFGVMPLPGMLATATVDDKTVSGIIENVTFTPPGILSIDVARYARLNPTQPFINMGTNS